MKLQAVVFVSILVIHQCSHCCGSVLYNVDNRNRNSNISSNLIVPKPNKLVDELSDLAKNVLEEFDVPKQQNNIVEIDDEYLSIEETELIDIPPPSPDENDETDVEGSNNKQQNKENVDKELKEIEELEKLAVKIEALEVNENQDDKNDVDEEPADHYHHLHDGDINEVNQ